MKNGEGKFLGNFFQIVGVYRIPGHPSNWILNVEATLEYYWISISICENGIDFTQNYWYNFMGLVLKKKKKLVCQVV